MIKKLFASLVTLGMVAVFLLPNGEVHASKYECTITIDANKHNDVKGEMVYANPTKGCWHEASVYGFYTEQGFRIMGSYNKAVKNGEAVDLGFQSQVTVYTILKGETKPRPIKDTKPKPTKPVPEPKPLPNPNPEKYEFVDVAKTNDHYEGITYWSENDVINGFPRKEDDYREYRPWEKLSRTHTAVLFTRALEIPLPPSVGETLKNYKDVPMSHPYIKEIASTYHAEIFQGSNGYFLGDSTLNREQMATVLVRAFELKDNNANEKVHLSNVGPSHKKNVQILADHEVTNQLKDYRPRDPVTRGQFATFMYRAMLASEKQTEAPVEDPVEEDDTVGKDDPVIEKPSEESDNTDNEDHPLMNVETSGYDFGYSVNVSCDVCIDMVVEWAIEDGMQMSVKEIKQGIQEAINNNEPIYKEDSFFYYNEPTKQIVFGWQKE